MRSKGQPRSALAALAERQHGVVSIRQLRGPLGYSASAVARAVRDGQLHRLHRGVFAVGHRLLAPRGECLSAVLAVGPGSLLSYRSAAWLWGLSRQLPHPFDVTAVSARRHAPPRIRVHRARRLTDADRGFIDNIPVTSLPRTLLDYASAVRFEQLQRAIERAEELELFDLVAVDALLGRTVGHPGHRRLQRALELYRPAPFTARASRTASSNWPKQRGCRNP
jgi:predicted transcriptional regulator of viral defense system